MFRMLSEWTRPLPGPAWVEHTDPEQRAVVRAHRPESVKHYAGVWLNAALIQDLVPKAILGLLMSELAVASNAIALPLFYAWAAWVCEFAAGILRSIADPNVAISTEKARRGIVKAIMVPLVLVMAAIIERMTFSTIHWDPGGKLVMTLAAGLIWESGTSVQRNVGGLWRSVGFQLPVKLPWTKGPDGDGGGQPADSEAIRRRVEAELLRQSEEHRKVADKFGQDRGNKGMNGKAGHG